MSSNGVQGVFAQTHLNIMFIYKKRKNGVCVNSYTAGPCIKGPIMKTHLGISNSNNISFHKEKEVPFLSLYNKIYFPTNKRKYISTKEHGGLNPANGNWKP